MYNANIDDTVPSTHALIYGEGESTGTQLCRRVCTASVPIV